MPGFLPISDNLSCNLEYMDLHTFWQYKPEEIMAALQTSKNGLSSDEAVKRISSSVEKKKERTKENH